MAVAFLFNELFGVDMPEITALQSRLAAPTA
jgi:hypothetical protein